jgi:tetraacyldisaccharide 4'-kinase
MAKAVKWLGVLFFPLIALYSLLVWFHHKLYDWGWRKVCRVPAPVISIGNIQLGGTGKTPLTEAVARFLQEAGFTVAVLTRGYARQEQQLYLVDDSNRTRVTPAQIGDEPYLLLQNVPKVLLGVDACRCCTARLILKQHPEAVFLLDDGFQHRALHRDLEVVLIDVTRWSRLPFTFPLTGFRDLPGSLRRADLFVLSGAKENSPQYQRLRDYLKEKYHRPVFSLHLQATELVEIVSGDRLPLERARGKRVVAFAGLAAPERFFRMLRNLHMEVVEQIAFPDHHHYTESEVDNLREIARERNASLLLCTQKDAVKLVPRLRSDDENFFYVEVRAHVHPEKPFKKAILEVVRAKQLN